MTNYINISDRERLETRYKETKQNKVRSSKFSSLLNRFWQHLVTTLVKGQEPRIWQTTNRYGNIQWHGYDPVTGYSVCRDSEEEMRIWFEQRYYQ